MTPQPAFQPQDPGHDNRRQFGRVGLDDVKSSLGQVLDLSAGGMRVECRRPAAKGASVAFTIEAGEQAIALTGSIAWARKLGFMRHQMGIQFSEMTPDLTQTITRFAIVNRTSQTMFDQPYTQRLPHP